METVTDKAPGTGTLNDTATVSSAAFFFCRYSIAALAWASWLLKAKPLVALVFALLALSAVLTVRRAPLVLLYTHTLNRIFPSPQELLSIKGMRFAHTLGAALALVCLLFLYGIDEPIGWRLTLLFCVVKTVSAFGLCPAYKLHGCMTSGSCCAFLKRRD
jgi:hypothetical protein